MRSHVLLACLAAACGPRAAPSSAKAGEVGITISLYQSDATEYGVVDDRRYVEINGKLLLLDNIDPGAALASLVIEPGSAKLKIGPCTRDRMPRAKLSAEEEYEEEEARLAEERVRRRLRRTLPNIDREIDPPRRPADLTPAPDDENFAPIVSCEVDGPPGRHLVRIVYVSTTLTYRTQHDIEMREPDKATVVSRFAFVTPTWRARASVAVFEGAPGGVKPPIQLVRGNVTLDGGTAVLVVPTRAVAANIRRIYSSGPVEDARRADEIWDELPYRESVWATLELPDVQLAPGPVRVFVDHRDDGPRWIDVPGARRSTKPPTDEAKARPLRLPLWIDDTLRGIRQRDVVDNDGVRMIEQFSIGISNIGDTAREVWIEEQLRPAKKRTVERAWPKKPVAAGNDVLRNKVEVRPGRVERVGYLVDYEL